MLQMTVVFNSFGVSIGMLDTYANVAPALFKCSRTWCLVGAGTAIAPIVMLVRRIEWLVPLSLLAMACVAAFVGFVVTKAAIGPHAPSFDATHAPSFDDVLETTSVVLLSFVCHFNVLPVHEELQVRGRWW